MIADTPTPRDQSRDEYRELPHDLEAERAVLGALLIERDAIIRLAPRLRVIDFYNVQHGAVFGAIRALYKQRVPADLVTVNTELTRSDPSFDTSILAQLFNGYATAVHAEYYAGIVSEMAQRRRYIELGGEVARLAWDASRPIDEVLSAINSTVTQASLETIGDDYVVAAEATTTTMDQLEQRKPSDAIMTGYADLDRMLGGFLPGQLIIVGARPGIGKSAFAMGILHHHCVRKQRPAGLVSLEMGPEQVTSRLLAIQGQVNMFEYRIGLKRDPDAYQRLHDAAGPVSNGKHVIVRKRNPEWSVIAAQARDMKARFGIDLFIIDYIGLSRSKGHRDNRVQELSEITRGLKLLAMDMGVPVIALSQLNRQIEQRGADAKPRLSDLRESGSLEQDADIVIFLHQPPVKPDDLVTPAIFDVAKNRDGRTGHVSMIWRPEFAQFVDTTISMSDWEAA